MAHRTFSGRSASQKYYEDAVIAIWREVLGAPDIDVSDDFFAIGGHALAPQVVAKIRRSLGIDIPVADLLESRTVAAQASLVAAAASTRNHAVTPRPPDAEPVLSFDQHRIWMESGLLPNGVYNNHARRRLTGQLDIAVVARSIREIIRRHETLRSRYPTVAGQPVVVVDDDPPESWQLPVADITGMPGGPADRERAAYRLLDDDSVAHMDPATGPLFRCLLVKVGDAEHILGITTHQIISDSRSIYNFEQELSALYAVGGDPARAGLPELTVQYRDYAVWQRRRLAGATMERQVGYWRHHLAGAPPVLELPAAHRRTAADTAASGRAESSLSTAEAAAFRQLCRAHDVTQFMAVFAALATVLGRWSGQTDFVIGVAFEKRTDSAVDKLVGIFFNALPFRVDLSGNPSFSELLSHVRRTALDGYAHAEAPIDVVVSDLQVVRDPRRSPLFEVVLNMTAPPPDTKVGDLAVDFIGTSIPRTRFDLFINAQDFVDSLRLTFDFTLDRFDDAMMQHLADHVAAVLRAAIAEPDTPVHDYQLGSPADSDALAAAGPDVAAGWLRLDKDDRFAAISGSSGMLALALSSARQAGAAQVIQPAGLAGDIGALASWLRRESVSALYINASTLRALAARESATPLRELRRAFVENDGGLLPHDVDALRELAPGAAFIGLYGVDLDGQPSAVFGVPDNWDTEVAPLRVPLGAVPAGSTVGLAGPSGHPVAVGEAGEIIVGSRRTGDIGHRRVDGIIEFLHRVGASPAFDPLETEAALRDVPGVRDAIVIEYTRPGSGTALLAYVAGPSPMLEAAQVYNALRAELPSYLMPEHIFVLDELPRMPGGDYDIEALPEFDEASAEAVGYVAPRSEMEGELVAILQDLLGIDKVGVHDSFFELGGFSMLATKLVTRVRAAYHVDLALRDIFDSPTVDQLARLIVVAQGEAAVTDSELMALLDEIEEEVPATQDAHPPRTVDVAQEPLCTHAVARLREAVTFGADKPDEDAETTLCALWYAAASAPCSIARASFPLPALSAEQERDLDALIERRVAGAPLAYLTGREGFLGLDFLTEPGALIPRRETEMLGNAVLGLAREAADRNGSARILDLGTGCGNLAVSLAVLEPRARIWAGDLEADAVAVASRNVAFHAVADRVTLAQGDLFEVLAALVPPPGPFDLVVCNPPYMPSSKAQNLPPEIGAAEPVEAFDGGNVGLSVIYRLTAQAPRHLVPGGWVCFEVGAGMGRVIEKRLAGQDDYDEVRAVRDSDGVTRVILARTVPGPDRESGLTKAASRYPSR